jgi:hypothetical protein
MPKNAAELVAEYKRIYRCADEQNRDLTQSERDAVVDLLERAKSQKSIEDSIREIGGGAGDYSAHPDPNFNPGGGPGDIFVQSKGYRAISRAEMRPSDNWSSGPIDVGPVLETKAYQMKGTLLEGATPGGGPLAQPDVRPGVVETLFQPLTIADALDQQQTTSMTVRYLNESTATKRGGAYGRGRRQARVDDRDGPDG